MTDSAELERQFALVVSRNEADYSQGLRTLRQWLDKDADGQVLSFLQSEFAHGDGDPRGRLAFLLAEHYRKANDLDPLERLYATGDALVKQNVLNALWSEAGPGAGPRIVALALDGATHADPAVRTEACYVFMNQAGYGVDVSSAIGPLETLLQDDVPRVRQQAAYATGNLAKRKYDVSSLLPQLRRNTNHKDFYARVSAAWALWHMSRYKHNIAAAVPELARLLADDHEQDEGRKNAAGALLHHARKSPENTKQVTTALASVRLDQGRREVQQFIDDFAKLPK